MREAPEGQVLDFMEHLGQLLGGTVGEVELRRIAMAAVARDARDLKLAIAEATWQARSLAAADRQSESARHMEDVRRLRDRYRAALEEYGRLASTDAPAELARTAPSSTQRDGEREAV